MQVTIYSLLTFKMPKPVYITNYFTTVGTASDRVSNCNHCDKSYNRPSGSTGSLRSHLSAKHPELFEELMELERAGAEVELKKMTSKHSQKVDAIRTESKFVLFAILVRAFICF